MREFEFKVQGIEGTIPVRAASLHTALKRLGDKIESSFAGKNLTLIRISLVRVWSITTKKDLEGVRNDSSD